MDKRRLDFDVPEKIGKYQVLEEVGRGACGVVYRGFDPFVQRSVAIKVARHDPGDSAEQTRQKQRDFFTEAHAAGRLQHPGIVALFDAGTEGELAYIVMEYIEGDTLLDYARSEGKRLSPRKAVEVAFQCAKALAYSHSQGVLHRDIKPGNIMLTRGGEARIMDFSIAEVTQSLTHQSREIAGSPAYMSPEQVQNGTIGAASDLYSLGAVLFQLLTGRQPFKAGSVQEVFRQVLKEAPPRCDELNSEVPKALADIVERCLRKPVTQRFQTGHELGAALTRCYEQLRHTEARLNRREHENALKSLSFFDGFGDEEIDEMLNASQILSFVAGQPVISEGEVDDTFYILAKGQAEVVKGGRRIDALVAGDCFGEIGFLSSTRRTATVRAVSDVMVLKVNASLMEQASPECQLRYYKAFTQTLIYRLSLTSARLSAHG